MRFWLVIWTCYLRVRGTNTLLLCYPAVDNSIEEKNNQYFSLWPAPIHEFNWRRRRVCEEEAKGRHGFDLQRPSPAQAHDSLWRMDNARWQVFVTIEYSRVCRIRVATRTHALAYQIACQRTITARAYNLRAERPGEYNHAAEHTSRRGLRPISNAGAGDKTRQD